MRPSFNLFISCFLIVPTNGHTIDNEQVEEQTGRAVRTNRSQGRHAYQLENALKPATKVRVRNTYEDIPEDVPANAMAPQVLHKAQSEKNRVISVFFIIERN